MRRALVTAETPLQRIAVLSNDALGNFAVVTPLLQMVRARHPNATLHYFGGTRIHELSQHLPFIDASLPWLGTPLHLGIQMIKDPYDWVINVENSPWMAASAALISGDDGLVNGPCLAPDGRGYLPYPDTIEGRLWRDERWREGVTERHPEVRHGHISEIFARIAGLEGDVPPYALPSQRPNRPVPDVLIATTASLPEKLWRPNHWCNLAEWCRRQGLSVGLIGAKPATQSQFWKGADAEAEIAAHPAVEDLRGIFTLPEVVGALATAKVAVTLDNGIMHFAVASGTPTVALFRRSIHRLWAPPAAHLHAILSGEDDQVAHIEFDEVRQALEKFLNTL